MSTRRVDSMRFSLVRTVRRVARCGVRATSARSVPRSGLCGITRVSAVIAPVGRVLLVHVRRDGVGGCEGLETKTYKPSYSCGGHNNTAAA